jgi:hypothetical protein
MNIETPPFLEPSYPVRPGFFILQKQLFDAIRENRASDALELASTPMAIEYVNNIPYVKSAYYKQFIYKNNENAFNLMDKIYPLNTMSSYNKVSLAADAITAGNLYMMRTICRTISPRLMDYRGEQGNYVDKLFDSALNNGQLSVILWVFEFIKQPFPTNYIEYVQYGFYRVAETIQKRKNVDEFRRFLFMMSPKNQFVSSFFRTFIGFREICNTFNKCNPTNDLVCRRIIREKQIREFLYIRMNRDVVGVIYGFL